MLIELKVHKKTVKTADKQDLSPDLNPFDYIIWGVLENQTNITSHPNIGSLKPATRVEWNKMYEEFILKVCKSFQKQLRDFLLCSAATASRFKHQQ